MNMTIGPRAAANLYGDTGDTLVADAPPQDTPPTVTSDRTAEGRAPAGDAIPGAGLRNLPPAAILVARALADGPAAPTGPHTATIATPNPPPGISADVAKERGAVLDALSADFRSALDKARQDPSQSGPGWVTVFTPARGGGGAPSGGNTAATAIGKTGGALAAPSDKTGQHGSGMYTRVFSETAFRDSYLAARGAALQTVAKHYGAGTVAQLLEAHPELRWIALDIVTADTSDPLSPAFNGEAPAVSSWAPPYGTQALMAADPVTRARMERLNAQARQVWEATQGPASRPTAPTASADELRAIDAALSTQGNKLLLAIYATNAPPEAELDPAKVATYGLQRAQAMAQLEQATAAANLQAPVPVFRGEAVVPAEWLIRRAELARQLLDEFRAQYQPTPSSNGTLSAEPLTRASAWRKFVATNETAQALAVHLGAGGMSEFQGEGAVAEMAKPSSRAGPAPSGHAMATPEALGAVDLALNDPDNQALIQQFGGSPPVPTGALANEQVRLYGLTRYQAMTQLSTAMAAVRQDYLAQLNNARTDAANPAVASTLPFLQDGKFSVEAFTAWYEVQSGAANQAFTRLMGPMSTREVPSTDEFGGNETLNEFVQSPWALASSQPRPGEPEHFLFQVKGEKADFGPPSILSIDPQAPPELNDFQYVGFDASLGWITPRQNIHHHESGIGQVLHDVVVISIAAGFGAVAGGEVAAWLSGSTGVVAGAAVGAATSTAFSGAMSHNFSWRDVLKAGLIGGATAGLSMELAALGPQLQQFSVLVTNPAFNQALTQGTIAALQGESFGKAALVGFASGMAQGVGKALNAGIDKSLTMSALEKAAARTAVRALTSAIQIAGDPEHPSQAFAAAFVKDFVNSVVNDIDFEKEIWGTGTPEQLSEPRLAERTKEFLDMKNADGKPVFSTPAELAALRRLLLQSPDLTPEGYRRDQIRLVQSDIAYAHSASSGEARTPPENVERVSRAELNLPEGVKLYDKDSGFYAEIFRDKTTGKYTVAYRGTDNWADMPGGNSQSYDPKAEQYRQAGELAHALKDLLGDQLEGFTGHSLGGGLAAMSAALTGTTATTFNAAGVSQSTIDANLRQGADPVDASTLSGRVVNYRLQGDLVTGLQENGSLGTLPLAVLAAGIHGYMPYALTAAGVAAPNALGSQVTLMPVNADGSEVGFFTRIFNALYLHSREALLPSMPH